MKKICVLLTFLLVFGVAFAVSSPVDGKKFEFSTGISFATYSYHYPGEGAGYTDTESMLNVPIRFGWFFWKGLELEPELMWTKYHEKYGYSGSMSTYNETGRMFSANLLYNFTLKNSHFMPFVLAGWGFGNGLPWGDQIERYDPGAKASTPNLGVGVKYLIGNVGALRLEYRYR